MTNPEITNYLACIGIRKINELDTALIEVYGQEEGGRHIKNLTALFDQSEERLLRGSKNTPYLRRQEALVDYMNQSLEMSLMTSSFYDRVFFRRAMEYLLLHEHFFCGDIFDIGCGNGILTCFLALRHPDSQVTGIELSQNAVNAAKELAKRLKISNVQFVEPEALPPKSCDTLLSCRTAHENAAFRPLCEEVKNPALSLPELTERHKNYASELSELIKAEGHLISIERYEDDNAYAGLKCALNHAGFVQERGTHMQFSCKNGDEAATFQGMVFSHGS